MCLRPPTPSSLTKPVSFGVIDPSRRVSRAELDRLDLLWREKHQRTGPSQITNSRASIESDMTRVEGRHYQCQVVLPQEITSTANTNNTTRPRSLSVKTWLFPRKQQQVHVAAA
ncbi:hypothetical protein CBS101457_002882 [Exobasidium rhododendri]|nr:hypothetical protein CBS101457_002882 [Exobasidium rhododendri]